MIISDMFVLMVTVYPANKVLGGYIGIKLSTCPYFS